MLLACRNTDVPIDPETAEPVEVETPNEVSSSMCYAPDTVEHLVWPRNLQCTCSYMPCSGAEAAAV